MSSPSLLPLMLLLVGGWLVGWGFRRRGALGTLPDGWRRITGSVIDVGDGMNVPPRIEYRTPDGRRLRVPGPMATPFTVGQEIAVLVDPSDPTRARLDLTEREAVRVVGLLIGVGAVLLLLGGVGVVAFL
ncbi:MAG: DUF3592 domain-containing protein [Aeromicrobium sp.]